MKKPRKRAPFPWFFLILKKITTQGNVLTLETVFKERIAQNRHPRNGEYSHCEEKYWA